MIKTLILGGALMFAAPAWAASPQPADRAALEQLARKIDDGWTTGDVEANTALFTEDATARFAEDPLAEGHEALRQQLQSFFKDRPEGLRHVTKIDRMEQLTPNLALWEAEVRIDRQ